MSQGQRNLRSKQWISVPDPTVVETPTSAVSPSQPPPSSLQLSLSPEDAHSAASAAMELSSASVPTQSEPLNLTGVPVGTALHASSSAGAAIGVATSSSSASTPARVPSSTKFSSPYYKQNSGTTTKGNRSGSGKLTQDEKQRRRLARKAELARLSRRKKKQYVSDLEAKVAELSAKVAALESQARQRPQPPSEPDVSQLLATGASPEDLVQQLLGRTKKNSEALSGLLERIGKSVSPCQQVVFLQWALRQPESFFHQPNGLWQSLQRELALTDSQREFFMKQQTPVQSDITQQRRISSGLNELSGSVLSYNEKLSQLMAALQQTLTPEQFLALYDKVQQNTWLQQMTTTMWSLSLPPSAQSLAPSPSAVGSPSSSGAGGWTSPTAGGRTSVSANSSSTNSQNEV